MDRQLESSTRLNSPFLALQHANFRYYAIGMIVSMIGTWMQNIALPWLAYDLTHSALMLSLIGVCQFTPVLVLSLFAGVMIDQYDKKTLIMLAQAAFMVLTLILGVLTATGRIQLWHIFILSALMGVVNTVDMPARQAFIIELVGKQDLMNAIALNATIFNSSRLIGPAIAGLVMASVGIATCFYINSISFAAVLLSLFFIHPVQRSTASRTRRRIMPEILDGLRAIRSSPILLEAIALLAVVTTFGPNFNVLLPVYVRQVLHLEETAYGLLMSFVGLGSLIGGIFVAVTSRRGPRRAFLTLAPLAVGAILVAAGFAGSYVLMSLLLIINGLAFSVFAANANSTLQLNCSDAHRGRVMSVYALVFSGSTPIGNLYAGAFTDRFGAPAGFFACGAIILILLLPVLLLMGENRRRGLA